MLTLPYLTLLDRHSLWFSCKMPEPKKEKAGVLSNYERQNTQKLYTEGGVVFGSVRNLVKTSSLLVSKVRQFSHSNTSYTKFTLAARKFK